MIYGFFVRGQLKVVESGINVRKFAWPALRVGIGHGAWDQVAVSEQ